MKSVSDPPLAREEGDRGTRLRAMLVSYVWPPTGGAGVGRVLKLAKYLSHHGVSPRVLTVSNPSVPLHDDSLELTRVEYDENQRWLALLRGDLAVLVNFATEARPLARAAVSLLDTSLKPLLISDDRMQVTPDSVVLPPHSVSVLAKGR